MSTKMMLRTKNGTVMVEVPDDDLPMPELIELVIKPVMRGAGFAEETIKDHFSE